MKILLVAGILAGLVCAAKAQPVVTSGPTNLTVNAGSAAYFSVTASDAATNAISYQWTNAQGDIPGATNAAYAFDNVSTNQAGAYGVIVSAADGAVTNSATLTVLQGTVLNVTVSGFASGPSNLVMELFDHDKPATVENFLHYVRSGAYSNLFVDRLIPGFVIQSGDFDAINQTDASPNLSVSNYIDINNTYIVPKPFVPPLPLQVNNEFYFGPVVSNRANTVAMALPSGNANGGTSAFFINLADNSGLDSTQTGGGPYVVFGRVIGGNSVLSYFNNNFSKPSPPSNQVDTINFYTNGIFDYQFLDTNSQVLTDLPENFQGTNIPANDNLFFLGFSFSNAAPAPDTNAPTVAVTFPTANAIVTNTTAFTVTGTAADNVGLALVRGTMQASDGAKGNQPVQGYADSVANGTLDSWTLNLGTLDPGTYSLTVWSQDGEGNISLVVTNTNVIVTAIITNGMGTVSWTNVTAGGTNSNAVGSYMPTGDYYVLEAHPGPGQLFANWLSQGAVAINPDVPFGLSGGAALTVTFISNNLPSNSVAFTYPPLNGSATNGTNLVIQGTLNGLVNTPVSITCRVCSYYNTTPAIWLQVPPALQTTADTDWSVTDTNVLSPGQYVLQVTAQDSTGNTTIVTNKFNVLSGLALTVNGPGTTAIAVTSTNSVPPVGNYLEPNDQYTITAIPESGAIFLGWFDGTSTTFDPVKTFTMSEGMSLTATFASNNLPTTSVAITYPPMNGSATNGTNLVIQGTLNGLTNTPVSITCRLGNYANSSSGTWSEIPVSLQTTGLTNWSLTDTNILSPGLYLLQVIAQDTKGNGAVVTNKFNVLTGLALKVNGPGTSAFGKTSTNSVPPIGDYLQVNDQYTLTATPNKGASFAGWFDGTTTSLNPVKTFTMSSGLSLTATFVSNGVPKAVAITSPKAGAQLKGGDNFQLAGTIKSSITATQILCQLFYNSNAITPPMEATGSTATWSLATKTNLAPGRNYTALVTAYDAEGQSTLVLQNFGILARLSLGKSGLVSSPHSVGTVAVSPATVDSYYQAGTSLTLTAKAATGYLFAYWVIDGSTNYYDPTSMTLSTNEIATAYFGSNYYQNVSGTYKGLFYPTNSTITPSNSGSFDLELARSGAATLDVILPGHTFILETGPTGSLPYNGQAGAQTGNVDGYWLAVGFKIGLTNNIGTITGYVYNYDTGSYANLVAYQAVTKAGASGNVKPGPYVLSIPGDGLATTNQPGGDGYATYTISSSGDIKAVGYLADGTSFSTGSSISAQGIWPLYAPLYKNSAGRYQGMILGWQTNYDAAEDSNPTNAGQIAAWIAPAKTDRFYTGGFLVATNASLGVYASPAAQSSYEIIFGGASLTNSLTNLLTVTSAGMFAPSGTTDTAGVADNLAITSFNKAAGVITGKFTDPATGDTLSFKGAFVNPSQGGSGYFLDAGGRSGYVIITAAH